MCDIVLSFVKLLEIECRSSTFASLNYTVGVEMFQGRGSNRGLTKTDKLLQFSVYCFVDTSSKLSAFWIII